MMARFMAERPPEEQIRSQGLQEALGEVQDEEPEEVQAVVALVDRGEEVAPVEQVALGGRRGW